MNKNFKDDFFDEFGVMVQEMNRLFNHFLKAKIPPRMSCHHAWQPPTDVFEIQEAIVVKVEVAGMREKDLEISIEKNVLQVSGKRKETSTFPKNNYYQLEINYGYFERTIPLPHNVATGKIKANYKNGFLEIIIPKLKPKKVNII